MQVPLLDVNAQNLPLEAELKEAFHRVLHSGRFIMGEEVVSLESNLAELAGTKHAIGVSSGTDALLLALMALDIGPGDEVICPSFTFFASAGCIARTGAEPVFCDVCPVCFNIDSTAAAAKITSKTKAIMPVHLFGQSADMDSIMALAQEHSLRVIEDGAQALGAKYRGKPCMSMGDMGATSFFPSKNLGGFGDSGMLFTNDDALADRARILRMHGMEPKYFHPEVGANFRIDPLQAALLQVKLPHYAGYTAARQANAADYVAQLLTIEGVVQADPEDCGCAGASRAKTSEARIVLPVSYPHNEHIWNQFTMRLPGDGSRSRDALKSHLEQQGIGAEVYYPLTMDQQACFADLPLHALNHIETARDHARECLSIPVYPELTGEQRAHVVGAIRSFLESCH